MGKDRDWSFYLNPFLEPLSPSNNSQTLAPRGELEEPYDLVFGRNGKPFFVAGPYDNAPQILKQLEKTAGPGNYDYLVMFPETF